MNLNRLQTPPRSMRTAASVRTRLRAISDIRSVMRILDDRLPGAFDAVPERRRRFIPNALLNLAMMQLLSAFSRAAAVHALRRLADFVEAGSADAPEGFVLPGEERAGSDTGR